MQQRHAFQHKHNINDLLLVGYHFTQQEKDVELILYWLVYF